MNWVDLTDPRERTIGKVLRTQAATIGDDVFLMDESRRMSYAEVDERVNRIANGLLQVRTERGDRIALLMANSSEMACTAMAINKVGATWVPINTSLKGSWLADAVNATRAVRLVVDDDLYELDLAELPTEVPVVVAAGQRRSTVEGVLTLEELMSDQRGEPGVEVDHRDVTAVMWTSGTTGKPKGVMQTHSSWLTGSSALSSSRDARDGDVFYCCLPMFNSGGWSLNVFGAMCAGLAVGIDANFSASRFWERCKSYGATQVITLGAMYEFLSQVEESPADRDHSVRVCACIPIPPERVAAFKERFAITNIWSGYAQSELMFMTGCTIDRSWKPGSCGVASDRVELVILDPDDHQLPAGEVGEIAVRPREPDLMFAGYFDDPETTLKATRNLWYHTGDLGYLDEDGELFFADRKTDLMRFAGRTISAVDVERAALGHAAVRQAAATGVPVDAGGGETEVMLTVVLSPGATLTAGELARFINDTAPHYLVPRYIDFVDSLPLTPTGKIEKRTIRDQGVTERSWDRIAAGFELRKR